MTMKNITRGGQFLVKETKAEDIFTPEDFSEEQKMMRDSVIEFVDRELWPNKARFEKKDYAFTEEMMRKAGELGLLGVAVPEQYGGLEMGFVSTMLVCDYISGTSGSFSTALEHIQESEHFQLLYTVQKSKNKNTCQNWPVVNGLEPIALRNQELVVMPILAKQKQFFPMMVLIIK